MTSDAVSGPRAEVSPDPPGADLDPPRWLARALGFRAPAPIDETAIDELWAADHRPDPCEQGVAELLRIAETVVEDERARGRTLDTKTASLVGFSGLVLSAETALTKTLFAAPLGTIGTPIARGAYFVSMLSLLYAAAVAVAGVLMPQKYRGLGRDELRSFRTPATQAMSALQVQQAMLGAAGTILWQDRPVNDFKARLVRRVATGLLIGFVGLAAQGLTIAANVVL
jgi:hypothetical protein